MKITFAAYALIASSTLLFAEEKKAETDFSKLKVDQIYNQLCSSCHGANFEGGMGGSLVDGKWKHGSSDEEITKSIKLGNAQLGMTPFGTVLDDQQIRGLVIYLREKEKEHKLKGIDYPEIEPGKKIETKYHSYTMEIVTEGLDTPWSLAFLPDGKRLVTERGGTLRIIEADGTLDPQAIKGTPPVLAEGQGGLLEVTLHPDYKNNGWIYLALSDIHPEDLNKEKGKRNMTAIYRGKIDGHQWVEQEVIWRSNLTFYTPAKYHYGTRMVFKDGYLFFAVGERGAWHQALDPANAKGKMYRIHDDGRIPKDNPSYNRRAVKGLWSIGHRNPQGMAFDPRDGTLYSTEHGPRGGDELNIILPNKNYGWPVVSYGMNYNGKPFTEITERKDVEPPVTHWTPSIAVCGLDFYTGDLFSEWKNDLFVGGLRQKEVRRVRLIDQKVTEQEIIFKNYGRVRDVRNGPDGYLYIVLNEPEMIVRLKPE